MINVKPTCRDRKNRLEDSERKHFLKGALHVMNIWTLGDCCLDSFSLAADGSWTLWCLLERMPLCCDSNTHRLRTLFMPDCDTPFLSLFNYWRSQLHNKCWPLSSSSHNEHSHSMTSCLGEQTGIPCFPNFYPPMYFKEAQPVFSFFIYWREKVCHASSKCQHCAYNVEQPENFFSTGM